MTLPSGVFAASLTPLNNDLTIDSELMISHCKSLLQNGCDGLAIFGTTGEANSFSLSERKQLLNDLVADGIPSHKLLIGTGSCAVTDAVELTKHAVNHNVGGVLVLPPFYYKNVGDDGIYNFFAQLIDKVNDHCLRIYLYHFPQMAQVSFSLSVIEKMLVTFPEMIVGIKDSGGDWSNTKMLCETFSNFRVFAGSEFFLNDMLQIGGYGCISASTNLTSRLAARVKETFPTEESEHLQKKLNAIRKAIEKYPMIAALKFLMAHKTKSVVWNNIRPPLTPLSLQDGKALLDELADLEFFEYCT